MEKYFHATPDKKHKFNKNTTFSTSTSQVQLDNNINLKCGTCQETSKNKISTECLPRSPDGGWGWLVVLGCFIVYMFNAGLSSVIGIFLTEIMDITNTEVTTVSWIGSLFNGFVYLIAPMTGPLTKIYGSRKLTMIGGGLACIGLLGACFTVSIPAYYILLGILPGCGMGLAFTPAVIIVGEYFNMRRPFAVGVAVSGAGVGLAVFPPFISFILDIYNFQGTLMIMSGLALFCVFAGSLFVPLQPHLKEGCSVPYKKLFTHFVDISLFRNTKFILILLASVLILFAYSIPFTFLPVLTKENKLPMELSAFSITILGALSTVARLGIGSVVMQFSGFRSTVLFLGTCISGGAFFLVSLGPTFVYLALFSAIFGATTGIIFSVFPDVLIHNFGAEKLPCTLGLVYLSQGIGGLIGPPIAGTLVDSVHTSYVAFYLGGTVMLSASMLLLPLICWSANLTKPVIETDAAIAVSYKQVNQPYKEGDPVLEIFTITAASNDDSV